MPVCFNSSHSGDGLRKGIRKPFSKLPETAREHSNDCITIGLINNMPDGALEATERQFLSLLESASDGIQIRLSLYSLPGVHRSEEAASHVQRFYSSADTLLNKHLDGLIVTGREPLAQNLAEEPYWDSFTRVLEWARHNTYATVWSCLAAHAALLHMDGIGRVRSQEKYCGVFECARVADHSLTAGTPLHFKLPHSRWNGVPEDALTTCGYRVLTRAADVGVDTFVKQYKSLFVFFQGHPEYESDTLLREYRRDIGRYIRGETHVYPLMPRGYFDPQTAIALTALENDAQFRPREELLEEVSAVLGKLRIECTWNSTAKSIYRNWLEHICTQKQARLKSIPLLRQHPRRPDELPLQVSSLSSIAGS